MKRFENHKNFSFKDRVNIGKYNKLSKLNYSVIKGAATAFWETGRWVLEKVVNRCYMLWGDRNSKKRDCK
jgi:hypothetical protein